MNTIFADKLFENKGMLNTLEIEAEKSITLDFSGVKDFNINNLYTLLDLQKLALYNNATIAIKNTAPHVSKILMETGIYKTLNGFCSNPIKATKRLSFS